MGRLIGYAGKEDNAATRYELKCHRAYMRFKHGFNTMQIAEQMNVNEATALRYLARGRSMAKDLPDPYARNGSGQ